MKRRGSVTVFFSLLLAVLLLLLQVMFRSVQVAGGRVQAEGGVEEGLYSAFSGYDRMLFERYHVFFLDGGYGSGSLQPGQMLSVVESYLAESCSPGLSSSGKNIWNLYGGSGSITAYTLATDLDGRAFRKQAVDYMKDTAGIQGVQLLLEKSEQQGKLLKEQENKELLKEGEAAEAAYEDAKDHPKEHTGEENDTEVETSTVEVPQDFQNPLDVIRQLRKQGVLGLVLPTGETASSRSFSGGTRLSQRGKAGGMGVLYTGDNPNTVTGNLLFREYMMQHLSCYTSIRNGSMERNSLQYQLEYTVAGKNTDTENLKAVVNRLLLVREASNMAFLISDPSSQAKVAEFSAIISTMIGFPELEPVVRIALQAAWAFGESLVDVRQLLLGGNVPMIKSAATWNVRLENLAKLTELLRSNQVISQSGQSYEEYLRALLYTGNANTQVTRTMDVVEDDLRSIAGKENFRMDHCVYYLRVQMKAVCKGQEFVIDRDYGYDM